MTKLVNNDLLLISWSAERQRALESLSVTVSQYDLYLPIVAQDASPNTQNMNVGRQTGVTLSEDSFKFYIYIGNWRGKKESRLSSAYKPNQTKNQFRDYRCFFFFLSQTKSHYNFNSQIISQIPNKYISTSNSTQIQGQIHD